MTAGEKCPALTAAVVAVVVRAVFTPLPFASPIWHLNDFIVLLQLNLRIGWQVHDNNMALPAKITAGELLSFMKFAHLLQRGRVHEKPAATDAINARLAITDKNFFHQPLHQLIQSGFPHSLRHDDYGFRHRTPPKKEDWV
jgi:hypothetical protein